MKCSYCGDYADTRDHVLPVSKYRTSRKGISFKDTIPACRECNSTLGNKAIYLISSRADYLSKVYIKKYSHILHQPQWSEEELNTLTGRLKESVSAASDYKKEMENRLIHLNNLINLEIETIEDFKKLFEDYW